MPFDLHVQTIVPLVGTAAVETGALEARGWCTGPLPLEIPAASRAGTRPGVATHADRDGRSTIFSAGACDVLYGSAALGSSRMHVGVGDGARTDDWALHGVELIDYDPLASLREPAGAPLRYLLAHWRRVADEPIDAVAALVRRSQSEPLGPAASPQLAPLALSRIGRVRAVVHAIPVGERDVLTESVYESSVARLAGAATEGPVETVAVVHRSSEWTCAVARDGVALVARTPASHAFHQAGRLYARTIYLDALLLAVLQLDTVAMVAARANEILYSPRLPDLFELRRRLLLLRGSLWSSSPTTNRSVSRLIVEEFRAQHGLDAAIADVSATLSDVASFIEVAQQVRTEEFARAEAEREARVDRLVAAIGVLLVVPSLVIGFVQLAIEPGRAAVLTALCLSMVLGLLGWVAASRYLRRRGSGRSRLQSSSLGDQ